MNLHNRTAFQIDSEEKRKWFKTSPKLCYKLQYMNTKNGFRLFYTPCRVIVGIISYHFFSQVEMERVGLIFKVDTG